jgi:copper chaperone
MPPFAGSRLALVRQANHFDPLEEAQMREVFSVPDVSCGHCKSAIGGAVSPLTGVESAVVDVDAKVVTVDFDTAKVSRDDVVKTIEDSGYPVAG